MSYFFSRAKRDGIPWPSAGAWRHDPADTLHKLADFARNLEMPHGQLEPRALYGIPTPWARLLAFETGLYDTRHPAHGAMVDEWRGLMGLLALHHMLKVRFSVKAINLDDFGTDIARVFRTFAPLDAPEAERHKWTRFQLILVDDQVVGATSARTLVFTGAGTRCPGGVPFARDGRLSDPVPYYRRFGDRATIDALAFWMRTVKRAVEESNEVNAFLGMNPGLRLARRAQLLEALDRWLAETGEQGSPCALADQSRLEGEAFRSLREIMEVPPVDGGATSDLSLSHRPNVIVYYDRERGSRLTNEFGHDLSRESVLVYPGHWIEASQKLPEPTFIPSGIEVVRDVAAWVEPKLIEIRANQDNVLVLSDREHSFLLPFKEDVLKYLSAGLLAQHTALEKLDDDLAYRVTLSVPVAKRRFVKVSHTFRLDRDVIWAEDYAPTSLVGWPEFTADGWRDYFYYKSVVRQQGKESIAFNLIGTAAATRMLPDRTWYRMTEPAPGFLADVKGSRGLLLIRHQPIERPVDTSWRVGIDFGSTHTRAFRLEVEPDEQQKWMPKQGSEIRPITIASGIKELTKYDPFNVANNFLSEALGGSEVHRDELNTHLIMPVPTDEDLDDWLPREGHIYRYSLVRSIPEFEIRHRLKWNASQNDYALRAFLRCLLLLLKGQATREHARIVSVARSYPSVFGAKLRAKHERDWLGLGGFSGVTVETEALMEAEAVARHLQFEQEASPASNVVALDVGGTTTDIAVWATNRLARQESVKMGAGAIGTFIERERLGIKDWLVNCVNGNPLRLQVDPRAFENRDGGYALMFHAILRELASRNGLEILINELNANEKGRHIVAFLSFLFSALSYYTGLLARTAGVSGDAVVTVFICGRGGSFVTWIPGYKEVVTQMFKAGLAGPVERQPRPQTTSRTADIPEDVLIGEAAKQLLALRVEPRVSRSPKQEVGRGLLADSGLRARRREEAGLISLAPPTVTAAEWGYRNLTWRSELTADALLGLPEEVPSLASLKELQQFVAQFTSDPSTREAAKLLKLSAGIPTAYRGQLTERLFGLKRGGIVYELNRSGDESVVEPLFITEAKVLLETLVDTGELF